MGQCVDVRAGEYVKCSAKWLGCAGQSVIVGGFLAARYTGAFVWKFLEESLCRCGLLLVLQFMTKTLEFE